MKFLNYLFLLMFFTLSYAVLQNLFLTADVWAPYTMDPKESKEEGVLIDMIREIFKKKGIIVTYEVKPYSRGLKDVKEGISDGVVGIYKPDAISHGFIVPNKYFGLSVNTFFVRIDDNWKYDNKLKSASLKGRTIGVIQDYVL